MKDKLLKLGYSEKWLEYGLLNEVILNQQIDEYDTGEDLNTEHYRYGSFLNWLNKKQSISIEEVENYIELSLADENELMGGSAIKQLFTSIILTQEQYIYIKGKLPQFGDWTKKLISRQDLIKEIKTNKITEKLVKKCWNYKIKFHENRLIKILIERIEDEKLLLFLQNFELSKKLRKQVDIKLKSIIKRNNYINSKKELIEEISQNNISYTLIKKCFKHLKKFRDQELIEYLIDSIQDTSILLSLKNFELSKNLINKIDLKLRNKKHF